MASKLQNTDGNDWFRRTNIMTKHIILATAVIVSTATVQAQAPAEQGQAR